MTNQQGAPEALTVVAPTKAQIIEGLRAVQSSIGWRRPHILDQPECTHWDYIDAACAALVEAQQPVAHVQNPAEIEHVAGDVSKNGPESNMAQQPAPSAAAAVGTNTKTAELLSTTVGLLMGYREGGARQPYKQGSVVAKVIDEVVDHLKDWPYPEPSPTPQADSQPAPVAAFEVADAMADSQYLAGVSAGWNAANADDPNAALQKLHESRAGYLKPLFAARAPADSVTAPALSKGEFKQFLTDVHTAAGLVSHGKRCKALGERLGNAVMRLLAAATAPAGGVVARVLLDSAGKPMLRPQLLDEEFLADPEAFDSMYPHRAPHRIADLYATPPAQAADSVQDLQPVHDAVTIDLLNERVAYLENKLKAADSVLEDAARWRAWANAMVEACNHSGSEEPPFLEALGNAIGDAEPPITLDQLNAWTDAALAAQREVKP